MTTVTDNTSAITYAIVTASATPNKTYTSTDTTAAAADVVASSTITSSDESKTQQIS